MAAAGVIVVVMTACEESSLMSLVPPTPSPSPVVPITVQWQHPLPQGNDLRRMWGFSDGSFVAVGEAGTVLRYDGSTWTLMDTPTREDLHGVWASDPSDVYAAGFGSTLIHYDGAEWSTVPTPKRDDYYAVWANATNDVFVAGTGGTVWNRLDGNWTEYSIAPGRRFRALWGYAHDEVYAAGSNGTLFRFDGSSWTRMIIAGFPQYDPEIRDMWGPQPGSISFVDQYSLIQWFDGATWSYASVLDENVYGLWGFSFENQVAVSAGTSTHLVAGVETVRYITPTEEPLFDVWGTSVDDYYAVGRDGNIAHFDGASWAALNTGSVDDIRDIATTLSGAIAVGAQGIILRQNGSSWSEENVGTGYDLHGVWQSGEGLVIAVGRFTPDGLNWRQAALVNTGPSWVDAGTVGNAHRLYDVWGSSASNAYAVGWAGEILRFDGSAWSVAVPSDSAETAVLRSVSGTSSSNVIAVGRTNDLKGLVLRYDGTQWTRTTLDGVEELCGVWAESPTNVFAVGSFGAIAHFDGVTWRTTTAPTQETLFGVWGSAANDVYAVGWAGTVVHYDGVFWRRLVPTTNRTLSAVAGRSANEIYFAGDKGAILYFDGTIDEDRFIVSRLPRQ